MESVEDNKKDEEWALSTLPEPYNIEDLVCVYKVKPGRDYTIYKIRKRIWLHDILDYYNIPYVVEVLGGVKERPIPRARFMYREVQHIYVEKKYAKEVKGYIKEFQNPKNILWDTEENVKNGYVPATEEDAVEVKKRDKSTVTVIRMLLRFIRRL